jgi:hypothetical protein
MVTPPLIASNRASKHAGSAIRLNNIGGGSFSLAAATFQKEERDDDRVTNGLYAFIEEKRRGYDGRVLAVYLDVFVRADETCHRLRLGLWTEELEQDMLIC